MPAAVADASPCTKSRTELWPSSTIIMASTQPRNYDTYIYIIPISPSLLSSPFVVVVSFVLAQHRKSPVRRFVVLDYIRITHWSVDFVAWSLYKFPNIHPLTVLRTGRRTKRKLQEKTRRKTRKQCFTAKLQLLRCDRLVDFYHW